MDIKILSTLSLIVILNACSHRMQEMQKSPCARAEHATSRQVKSKLSCHARLNKIRLLQLPLGLMSYKYYSKPSKACIASLLPNSTAFSKNLIAFLRFLPVPMPIL